MEKYILAATVFISLFGCADFSGHMREMVQGMHEDKMLRDSLSTKPGATIGMTTDQVLYETS
ncbi:hypothetical protein RGU75_02580 [Glaciimonas sp. CA11.2]|uniref:hypothetical protein n=1 Tax=Glaciimonas sp. CA11.2 TaxID=3048601 RepID=UPI002AB347C9|nr:hypothetical protein [Glaciimonas sp. CA11.2]MDY7545120.1 hypothetical protein [Glaciimonas sp. CA11.2]